MIKKVIKIVKNIAPFSLFTIFVGSSFIIITAFMLFCFLVDALFLYPLFPTPPTVIGPFALDWLLVISLLSAFYVIIGIVRLINKKSKKKINYSASKTKGMIIRGVISLVLSIFLYFFYSEILYILNYS